MSRFRPKLSYSNVMASIAVFAVLGTGVAVAHHAPNNTGTNALKNGAVTTQKLRNGAVTAAKLRQPLRPRWAVVNHNGSIERGRGAVDVDKPAASLFAVTFNRNITNCSYQATLTEVTGGDDLGFVSARASNTDPTDVIVETRNHEGVSAARSFSLEVSC